MEDSSALRAAYQRASQGEFGQARPYYEAGLRRHPDDASAWISLAAVLTIQEQFAEALVCAHKGLALSPNDPNGLRNLSQILHQLERYDECRPLLERVFKIEGPTWRVCLALALNAYALGDLAASEQHFIGALGAAGTLGDEKLVSVLCTHMAYPVLGQGDYRRGLALLDHRFNEVARTQVWELGAPEWKGEHLAGKHLLVHHDEGDGDTIQFSRFLPMLEPDVLSLAVPRRLMPLFTPWVPHIRVLDLYGDLPTPDYHSPLGSYFRYAAFLNPATHPWYREYLAPAEGDNRFRDMLDEHAYRIGIVWACRPTPDASRRNIPVGPLLALSQIPDVRLYSFQVGPAAKDVHDVGVLVTDLSLHLPDWGATAAAMHYMDLIVSVDSAPLHLAGAMGRPCVGLIPFRPCWRWHPRDSDRTPWYPSMRLLRQERARDWSAPLARLHELVRTLVVQRRCRVADEFSEETMKWR